MSTIVSVTPYNHGKKIWKRLASYQFASGNDSAALVAAEIPRAALCMPIAFVRHNDRYILTAILSPLPGRNFFVGPDGRWIGGYIPACFRSYPFILSRIRGQSDKALCVDEGSGIVSDAADGEPFFDENNNLSEPVKAVFDFLIKIEQNRIVTEKAVASLAEADLISQWPLTLKLGDQEKKLPGLYKIDEAALNRADNETFLKIRKTGALPIAYAQLLSMGNIRLFYKLAELQEEKKSPSVEDIGSILREDDIFKF